MYAHAGKSAAAALASAVYLAGSLSFSTNGSECATQFRAPCKCRVVCLQSPVHPASERSRPGAAGRRASVCFE
jgi:hypothetical protein